MKTYAPISFREKFAKFSEQYSPKVIAPMNDYELKLVRLQGEFVWHSHADTDETFIVLDGQLTIEFRDGRVVLGSGEMFVVPRGVEHKPVADEECWILLFEPASTLNTGNVENQFTLHELDRV
jgi:mannose-6-phosphate isomerase-like protein (cupin superfamily)